ncbi:MAG: hypothetical protein Q9218_006702 [Villophora microphyllina]
MSISRAAKIREDALERELRTKLKQNSRNGKHTGQTDAGWRFIVRTLQDWRRSGEEFKNYHWKRFIYESYWQRSPQDPKWRLKSDEQLEQGFHELMDSLEKIVEEHGQGWILDRIPADSPNDSPSVSTHAVSPSSRSSSAVSLTARAHPSRPPGSRRRVICSALVWTIFIVILALVLAFLQTHMYHLLPTSTSQLEQFDCTPVSADQLASWSGLVIGFQEANYSMRDLGLTIANTSTPSERGQILRPLNEVRASTGRITHSLLIYLSCQSDFSSGRHWSSVQHNIDNEPAGEESALESWLEKILSPFTSRKNNNSKLHNVQIVTQRTRTREQDLLSALEDYQNRSLNLRSHLSNRLVSDHESLSGIAVTQLLNILDHLDILVSEYSHHVHSIASHVANAAPVESSTSKKPIWDQTGLSVEVELAGVALAQAKVGKEVEGWLKNATRRDTFLFRGMEEQRKANAKQPLRESEGDD